MYFPRMDGRMIFAIPRNNKTYVGTTDTTYDGDIANLRLIAEDGKLIGYRKMAQDIVDVIVKQFKIEESILYSHLEKLHMLISGGDVGGATGFELFKAQKVSLT